MGAAALTKKRGGYTNTKLHGIMAWVGMMIAGGGLYVIYQNKESMGKNHFTTYHSWGKCSVICYISCTLLKFNIYNEANSNYLFNAINIATYL